MNTTAAACLAGLALAVAAAGAAAASADDRLIAQRAQRHYTQFCSGCHLPDGSGAPAKGVPSMHGMLDRFLSVPGGREFIVQVPGVMNSGLKDEEVAQLMNWLVPRMAEPVPGVSPAYTAAEIAALRRTRPADVPAVREALVRRIEHP